MSVDNLADWVVDLDECTASHRDGWVFKIYNVNNGAPDLLDMECIGWPDEGSTSDLGMDHLAKDAAQAYLRMFFIIK